MAQFSIFDHDSAMLACLAASASGASGSDTDVLFLSRVILSVRSGSPDATLSRLEYTKALANLQILIDAARKRFLRSQDSEPGLGHPSD